MKPNTRQPRPPKAPVLKPEPLKTDWDGQAALGKQVAMLARARSGK